jgi:hypothetical protein
MRAARTALLAALVASAAGAAPAGAGASDQPIGAGDRGAALRYLQRHHLTVDSLGCARRGHVTTCRWTAAAKLARCTGRLVMRARGHTRSFRLSRTCTPLAGVFAAHATGLGFNTYDSDQYVALQKAVGATTTRLIVEWNLAEPLPGAYSWTQFDDQYARLVAAGIRPLVMVYAAPCWARPRTPCAEGALTGPPDSAFEPAWSRFVAAVTRRYPSAAGIEVWNEPNLTQYFWPRPDPGRYATLLRDAARAAHAVRPGLPIISGGLAVTPDPAYQSASFMGQGRFLAGVYGAAAGPAFDGIGVHPYPIEFDPATLRPLRWSVAAFTRAIDQIRASRDAAGQQRQSIWITEVGESTTTQPGFAPAASLSQQSADLSAIAQGAIAAPDVAVVIVHTLVDLAPNPLLDLLGATGPTLGTGLSYNGVNEGFGVFTADGRPKPAACALAAVFRGSLSCSATGP